MPDTPTARLGLYKSKSDGSELVSYTQDVGQNLDKLDLAAGIQVVTSSTRPSAPYSGKLIAESDNAYRTYFSNGTAPASASWVEIPNSSAVYQGRFVTLFPGSTSSTSLMRLAQTGLASGSRAFATRGSGDTADHYFFDFDGKMQWSPGGSAVGDTNLYRGAANQLKTDDDFVAVGNLTAGNYSIIMDWTALTSLGSFTAPFAAGGRAPRMRKISQQGTEIWELEGTITTGASWTANSAQTVFTFSAGYRPASERGFATYAAGSAFYPIRVGIMSTGIMALGAPTAAGTGVTSVYLDGCRITNPAL